MRLLLILLTYALAGGLGYLASSFANSSALEEQFESLEQLQHERMASVALGALDRQLTLIRLVDAKYDPALTALLQEKGRLGHLEAFEDPLSPQSRRAELLGYLCNEVGSWSSVLRQHESSVNDGSGAGHAPNVRQLLADAEKTVASMRSDGVCGDQGTDLP